MGTIHAVMGNMRAVVSTSRAVMSAERAVVGTNLVRRVSICRGPVLVRRCPHPRRHRAQWISPTRLCMPHEYRIRALVLRALQWDRPLANGWHLLAFRLSLLMLRMATACSIPGSLCAGGAC
jgi:hypothetical protein